MFLETVVGIPLLISLVITILWIWAIYDIIFVSSVSTAQKVFWLIIVTILSIVGIIFYLLLGREASDYKIVKR